MTDGTTKKAAPKKAPAKKTATKKAPAQKAVPAPEQPQADLLDALDIGRRLERARKALKMTLKEASEKTQIRAETLEALEQNRFEELPELVYVRGFIRSYAQVLELDAQELLRDLGKYLKTEETTTLVLPSPVEEGTLPSLKTIAIAVAVLLLVAGVWQIVDRPTHDILGPTAEAPQVGLPLVEPEVAKQIAEQAEPAPAFERPVNLQALEEKAENPQPEPVVEAVEKTTLAQSRIYLQANEDVWMSVYRKGAELPLFAQVLKAGQGYNVPDQAGLLLDVGLPPALTVYVDGNKMGISGVIDRRVRGLTLDADYLKNTYYPEHIYQVVNIKLPVKEKPSIAPQPVETAKKAIVEVPKVVIKEEAVPLALPTP